MWQLDESSFIFCHLLDDFLKYVVISTFCVVVVVVFKTEINGGLL